MRGGMPALPAATNKARTWPRPCRAKYGQTWLLTVHDDDHEADDGMEDDRARQDELADSRKNRLPSFTEVLSRRTRPPVDLFMF